MKKFLPWPRYGWHWCALATALFSLSSMLWFKPARALADIDPSLRVKILLTALSFDRGLRGRAGESVTILSTGECGTRAVLDAAGGKSIGGLPIRTLQAAATHEAMLKQALDENATFLFVCDASGKAFEAFLKLASERKLIMMVENAELVAKGAALGVLDEGGRPRLLLNSTVAKEAGADFDPRIFGVAKVVN